MHLQQLVNDLASDLGVSLLVEDREHRVVAFSPQFNDIDEVRRDTILTRNARVEVQSWLHDLGIHKARTPVRVPPNEALNMLPRVCVPVWNATSALGYLWVIDPDSRQDSTRIGEVALAGARIAAAWQVDHVTVPLTARERTELVHQIWAGSPAEVDSALARWRAELGLASTVECQPVLFRVALPAAASSATAGHLPSAAVQAALSIAVLGPAFWAVIGREVLVVLPANEVDLKLLLPALAKVCDSLGQQAFGPGSVRAGIGPAVADPFKVQQSVDLAQTSINIGDAFELSNPVSQWDSLGVHRAAYELSAAGMQPNHLAPGFADLLAVDGDGVLVHTLECYLASGCSARDTAATLRIHRTSLYYRLDRAASALACNLSEGSQRLGLHLALLVHRLNLHASTPLAG